MDKEVRHIYYNATQPYGLSSNTVTLLLRPDFLVRETAIHFLIRKNDTPDNAVTRLWRFLKVFFKHDNDNNSDNNTKITLKIHWRFTNIN